MKVYATRGHPRTPGRAPASYVFLENMEAVQESLLSRVGVVASADVQMCEEKKSDDGNKKTIERDRYGSRRDRRSTKIQSFHKKPSTQPRSIVPPICSLFRVNVAENQ